MWDKWKKKIQNFIWKEIEEEDLSGKREVDQQPRKNKPIQAKMVYQYPKQKNFHFPVIPDEKPKENQSIDIPAYKRRNMDKKPNKSEQQTEQPTNKVSNQNKDRKIYKKDESRPFKPSRVPSPIYGFQERKKEKDVQEVPAFVRKQTSNKPDTWPQMNENKEKEQLKAEEEKTPAPLEFVQTEEKQVEEKVINQKQKPNQVEVKDQGDEIQSPSTYSTPVHSNEKMVPKTKRKKEQPSKQENIPYNVIMTPRDKKNLFDRKRKNIEKKTTYVQKELKSMGEEYRTSFPYHLLDEPKKQSNQNDEWVEEQKKLLAQTLKHFNVQATVVRATQGPSVTRFEVKPELGVKVSRIRNLSDDLKLNMAAKDIRIEAPIPGKNTVGIEVPNLKSQMVGLQEIFDTNDFKQSKSPLTIALGLNIEGAPIITNIQKMPHGLIAGATGSGKSVCINTILISLLYKANHEDVKLLLIDPKMVELAQYNGIPHLVSPVITDVKAATAALKWAVNEMEERYEKFVKEGVRDIEKYNQKMKEKDAKDEKMPFIVIVIDELADLMMVSPQDVEDAISRIAQKARACGIHLILATQRPSVDVITGLIKANIPTRIAFSVSSQVDSRTIIDVGGAEKLLGKGDMLFVENGAGKTVRLQGAFVSDEEISRVTNHARKVASPHYLFEQESLLKEMTMMEEEDELMQDAIDFVLNQNSASTSMLQRHFKIGYNRAARLIDTLEQKGIISGQNGSKPRDILVTKQQIEEMYQS